VPGAERRSPHGLGRKRPHQVARIGLVAQPAGISRPARGSAASTGTMQKRRPVENLRFRLQPVQRWQARHQPRCRDSGPYFPLANGQAKAGPPAGSLELRPNRPDVPRQQGGFAPVSFPLFQGMRFGGSRIEFAIIGLTPQTLGVV
jgi:hypothetical protein